MSADLEPRVAAVRRFTRFYTRRIGVLQEGLLDSPFSLTEGRVLYELAHRDRLTAADLGRELAIDPGYLSRLLKGFAKQGLITKSASDRDGREMHLRITDAGRAAFAPLNQRSHDEVAALLAALPGEDRARLIAAMDAIERLLDGAAEAKAPYLIRMHQPGDMGFIVHRHGALYAQEYGFDERFEALVARIVADFIETFDAKRERCWVVERDGAIVGCVFLVRHTDEVAKLRLLYVEPAARGLGIGRRLVAECVRFAREARYARISLWTNSVLVAARRIYQESGFRLVHSEPHRSFGQDLMGETWELAL